MLYGPLQTGEGPPQGETEKKEGDSANVEEETEAEPVFDYDYNTMKSGPEIVSVSTDNMLELLYPLVALDAMCII